MGNIERYDLAKAAAPVVLREAEVEGISLTASRCAPDWRMSRSVT
jgi:hypothetical protein